MVVCRGVVKFDNNSIIVLEQTTTIATSAGTATRLTGTISGLTPGKHGLRICISGDLSDIPNNSCGPIYNPFGKTHGARTDTSNRMVGDLGNIVANDTGLASIDITDTFVTLTGPHSVIGRSLVVTAEQDDEGRGGHANSLADGNAGPRVLAGVIGLAVVS